MNLRERILGVGMRRRFQARVDQLNLPTGPAETAPVSDDDLSTLPDAAQRYLRFMGVVGRPCDWSFRARFVGEFRQQPGQKFMPCVARQYNTTLVPARVYYMRIDFAGHLPMFGVDIYETGHGRMRGKLLDLITVADGSGPEFDVGELTTYVNDALMLAPSMLLTPAVTWAVVDDHAFDVSMSDGGIRATSRIFVDEQGRMVDFSTTDRWATLPDGLTRARWTTPIDGWMDHEGRWLPTGGRAIWHLDAGEFEYVRGRFVPESVEFNVPPGTARI
jgi:Family of unknown function (DUF6544)